MSGSEPLEIRLSEGVEGWLGRENRRTKVTKGTLLEALAEESIRARRFLGTGFRSRNIKGGHR